MALNLYNIRKWYRMIAGKSVMHVNQDIGKTFDKDSLQGYYNNMTEKVTSLPNLLHTEALPLYRTPSGKDITFPVDVFQYGLGAYDLFLITGDDAYKEKFMQCCKWAVEHQEESGAWNTFFFKYPDAPYGGMSQGEAASLLVRGYNETGNNDYLYAARKAIDFMLISKEKGGCTEYLGENQIVLCEYTHLPVVLNGWIFAWFGLYDFVKAMGEDSDTKYSETLEKSLNTLEAMLPSFSCSYWSLYDVKGKMASPFYHRLHIAQMQAMYILTGHDIFDLYAKKWNTYLNKPTYKTVAFVKKAFQKIFEKEYWA